MSDQLSNPNAPKKKLKWYWWVLIVIVVFSIIGRLTNNQAPTSATTTEKPKEETEIKGEVEKPKPTSAEIDKLLSGLRRTKDEFEKQAFYYDPTTTNYGNVNAIYLYLGRDEANHIWPRLTIQYAGENWLFINSYRFLIDGQTRIILPEERIKQDNNGSGVWEVVDKTPSEGDLLLLSEIANSKVAKIRYEGRDRVFDRVISEKEKKALKRILGIYTNFK